MARKIETTTKKLKAGVAFSDPQLEVKWESTGHLSAQLFDASGTVPLARRSLSVEVPGEGKVELTTDDDGVLFHPDVPFQDYVLELEGGVEATLPAVATRAEVHRRIVAEVTFGFVRVEVRAGGE